MVVLLPCLLGYGEIGARLNDEKSSDNYENWISTYSGQEFQNVCLNVGDLFEKGLIARLGKDYAQTLRWQDLCQKFDESTQLKVKFWDMGMEWA